MSLYKKLFGQEGEEIIVAYLKNLGFRIICQNYKSRFGEIDIIAQNDDVLAFIEVKSRKDSKVYLSDLISYSKQQKIIKTAMMYISQASFKGSLRNNYSHTVFRFDVALLHLVQNKVELNYLQNAFTARDFSTL